MDGSVAAGAPAGAQAKKSRMRHFANINIARRHPDSLDLGVAFQAEIGIAFRQELGVDRAMGAMTDRAALAQGLMLENKRPRLIAMTLGTTFIDAGHCQAAAGFVDIAAVRIVALPTIHAAFDHRMMMGKIELGVNIEVTPKTGGRIAAGIDDKLAPPAAGCGVLAARPMAGFATRQTGHLGGIDLEPGMRAGHENSRVIRMAFRAHFIADIDGSFNLRGGKKRMIHRAA